MRIKNWSQFQHFKDRRPPWIKLHRDILDQRDINMLSDRSFRVLTGLWLLASEDKQMKGTLPPVEDIAFRLRMEKGCIIKALKELDPFLEYVDIREISGRYQHDDPETETETETETEVTSKSGDSDFFDFWSLYPRKEAKKKAEAAWRQLTKEKKQKALNDIRDRYTETEKKYIPLPTTYIHGERWDDVREDGTNWMDDVMKGVSCGNT